MIRKISFLVKDMDDQGSGIDGIWIKGKTSIGPISGNVVAKGDYTRDTVVGLEFISMATNGVIDQ